jgi:hypothetical protein
MWIAQTGLRCGHQPHQLAKPLLMNGPSLREGELLVALRLGPQKGTNLVEHSTEMCRCAKVSKSARGSVALLDAPMVLLYSNASKDSGFWEVIVNEPNSLSLQLIFRSIPRPKNRGSFVGSL